MNGPTSGSGLTADLHRDHGQVGDAAWWDSYIERVHQAADRHRPAE